VGCGTGLLRAAEYVTASRSSRTNSGREKAGLVHPFGVPVADGTMGWEMEGNLRRWSGAVERVRHAGVCRMSAACLCAPHAPLVHRHHPPPPSAPLDDPLS
jgi:hypothetical protein